MSPAIRSAKNADSASRKKYSVSTRAAIVDARSGKRGGMRGLRPPAPFSLDHQEDERSECEDRCGGRDPDGAHDDEAVPAGFGIVVIAVEEHLLDRRSDLPG